MSTEFKAPAGLVPVERRWPKALTALFRRKSPKARAQSVAQLRKAARSKEARR